MRVGPDGCVEHGQTDYAGHVVGFQMFRVFVDEGVLGYEVVVGLDCCFGEAWVRGERELEWRASSGMG